MGFVEEAAQEGYTQEEINGFLATKHQEAKAEGYSDEEISSYIKGDVLEQKAFNKTSLASTGHANLAPMKSPTTLMEAIETGWNWSNIALGREALKGIDGRLPTMQVDESTPIALRAAANITGTVADVPSMIAGGLVGGGPASPVTALGGAFALPMGLRSVFIDSILEGQTGTKKEFADRAIGTMWETAKGFITGAATGAVGKAATAAVSGLPAAAKAILPTAAEVATLTEVSARLEGHAPEPTALIDNAIVLGVAKTVLPSWAAVKQPNILHETYVKTGIPPDKVVHDAISGDKNVWQDTLDGRVPDAYKEQVEHKPSQPTQTQRGEFRTPNMTPEQQAQARAFMDQPFAEIPQAPNEPTRPTHINYNYIDTPEQAQQALSQLSTIYESKIQEQRQSPKAWEQSHQESAKVLADLLQSDPKTVTAFLKGEKAGPSTTAQLLARKELTLRFTEELMRRRAALMAKGEKATPEELVGFLAQVERVSNVQSAFLGQRADVARALNALKSTKREADRAQAIVDAVNQYGGAENVSKLVEMLGEYDNPAQAIKFAKEATKATKWEMVVEAWKAGLVSGLRTNEVNFLSTAAFTTLRLPTEAIAATIGAIKGKEDRVAFTEIPARMLGMTAGFRDGFKAAGAVLRTGDNILGTKTDTFQPAIPGKTGEVIRLPFRVLSAADVLFKTINERSELYAMATKQAMNERAMGTQPTKQQSVTFKTSKGSTYKVESDGTTTRDKAARPEHPGDQGVQPASETTFYVDEASMNKLSEFQAKGFVKRSIEKLPDGRVGIKYMDGKDAGKFESRTIITPESTPSVGLHPVELWEAGTRAHFGNKITEVSVPSVQAGDLIGKSLFDRIADIAANPSEEMAATAKDAAMRYTFNKPLGPAGKAFQHMVRVAHLEWMFPFITTPGNIFKETARMTPGLNFAVKEWRADYEAGGVRRDKALAEVAVGTAIMSAVVAASINGTITGNGTPDKAMRSTERAAGWKPYSVKINGQYVDGYLRMAPIGPLIGIAADGAEFMKYMTGDERDQWGRMLAFAFASNVTNQTFMTGATNFVNVLQDPSRYGQNYFESLASSVIPSIVGQTAADIDPLLREIHGIRDAMIARIPGQREGLMPKRDWTGQPIASPERLWWGSPFTVSTTTTDKVRLEAARIGFATPDIPKAIDVLPGKDFGKLDKVPLTLAQRDVFASQSGQLAYATLQGIVNTPGWETQPDIIKRQVYEKVMKRSRDMATKQLLLGQDPAVTQKIVDEITKSLK